MLLLLLYGRTIHSANVSPLTPTVAMGTTIRHPVSDRVKPSFVIFLHPGTLTLTAERQSARMSKITNDGLTRSGTGCLMAVPMATVGVKGLSVTHDHYASQIYMYSCV